MYFVKTIKFSGVLSLFLLLNIHFTKAQEKLDTIPFLRTVNIKTKFSKSTLVL